jgi:hypothetical protein
LAQSVVFTILWSGLLRRLVLLQASVGGDYDLCLSRIGGEGQKDYIAKYVLTGVGPICTYLGHSDTALVKKYLSNAFFEAG